MTTHFRSGPNGVGQMVEDDDVRKAALERGLLHILDGKRDLGRGAVALVFDVKHPTHWLIFARFYGYKQPGDNGYQLTFAEKAKCPEAAARALVLDIVANFGSSVESVETIGAGPEN